MSGLRPGGLELTRQLLAMTKVKPGMRALDIGCGRGESLSLLSGEFGCQVWGLEPDAENRAAAQAANPGREILPGRGEELPFPAGSFDLVLAECVLSLFDPVEQALQEIHRVLRIGGVLLLSDVYGKKSSLRGAKGMLRNLYTLEELAALLQEAGFCLKQQAHADDSLLQMLGQMIFDLGQEETYARLGLDRCCLRETGIAYILMRGDAQ